VTTDEVFDKLDDDLRRLKIEYEVYFSGGSPRPPRDTLFRVETTIKRYSSDQSELNFSQRFRFSMLVQKYAVHAALWRRRLQEKEEGRSVTGVLRRVFESPGDYGTVAIVCSDPDAEPEKVDELLHAMQEARRQTGEPNFQLNPVAFQQFIREKTRQVQKQLGCKRVRFSISIEDGRVRFKAARAR